jgi:hypothetical protein
MKLLQEELQQIKDSQLQRDQIIFSLGELRVQSLLLEDQLKMINNQQNELGDTLNKKYGEGQINLETGEITPINKKEIVKPATS